MIGVSIRYPRHYPKGAQALLKRLLRNVTPSPVCALIVPDIHVLSGPKKTRFELLNGEKVIMIPGGCQILKISGLIFQVGP